MLNNWQRIERVVKWTGLSVNSFAISVGLSRGENLYQIKRGNNGISRELVSMISSKYPQISRAWLLAGEGDMFIDQTGRRNSIPFYETEVEKYIADPARFVVSSYVSLPTLDDADFGAIYGGRAMGDSVPTGSMVLVSGVEVDDVIPGGDYVVVTDRLIILRRVRCDVESNTLRLMPIDTANFDEIRVDSRLVREMYRVRAVVMIKTI